MDDVSTVILILLSLSCITYYVHTNAFDMLSKQNATVQKPILWIYLNSNIGGFIHLFTILLL